MEVERIWAEVQQLFGQGKLDEAAELCDRLHRFNPAHPFPLHMLGVIASKQGRLHQALDLFGHAAAQAPGEPLFQADYASALHLAGRADEAMALLAKILAQAPDFAPARERRGYIHWRRERREAALADFDAVLRQHPERLDLCFFTG